MHCPPEKLLNYLGPELEEDLTPPFPMTRPLCAFCRCPVQGNYCVERDGFCDGPEVPLCDGCGEGTTPDLETIWDRISHVRNPELAGGAS